MAALTRYSNTELLQLPDCGGLLENGKCRWLKVPACIGKGCRYCQKANSQDKTYARLRTLDKKTQIHIAKKYYHGELPWQKT